MNKYENISKQLFLIALFLLSFIFFNIFISSVFFIFKISINSFSAILSVIFSSLINIFILKKNNMSKIIYFVTVIIVPLIIIVSSVYFSGKIYDYTFDGNSYHKATIGMLMDGWNPLYENMEDFDKNKENPMNVTHNSYVWGNHYAKASHIYAANIGILNNNVESGKSINILSIIMLFLFTFSVLLNDKKKLLFSLLFSLCLITCPTISSQYLTNYVDILVYIYFFLLISSFFYIEKSTLFFNNKVFLVVYFMTLVIAINIKFSLFGYAGVFCLGYYIWYLLKLKNMKKTIKSFKDFTIVSFLAVLTGVFVVGLSVYPKNYIEHGNIFYPIRGENKIDIMSANQPDYFKRKSPISKYIISTFSKTENITEKSGLKATYKIPFSIYKSEIYSLNQCDLRISGNGVLFSGILILSVLTLIFGLFKIYNKDKDLFVLMVIPLFLTTLMIFLLQESWWARYFPQTYLIVFFSILILDKYKAKNIRIFLVILFSLILINNFLVFYHNTKNSINYTHIFNLEFYTFEGSTDSNNCNLRLYTSVFHGAMYNVIEKEKEYSIKFDNKKTYNKNINNYNNFMDGLVYWRCQ